MKTKKLLVAFDEANPESSSGNFLAVLFDGELPRFLELQKGKFSSIGRVVYIGKEIDANDLFAKLEGAGRKIKNVEQTLQVLESYIGKLQEFHIGNIVSIESDEKTGFKLVRRG